jgi:eukaryotic-like serine/threonine-protein kinase
MGSEQLIGSTLAGRYVPQGILGAGANADVLVAADVRTGGLVALKVLQPQHRGRAAAEERIVREGRIAGQIRHPNVCSLMDVARLPDGSTFLVMELLTGESLEQLLARRGRLEVDEAVDIVYQVLAGLGAAHAKGFVHRDVKPANVFLVPLGPRSTVVKVLDFGGAVATDGGTPDAKQLTGTGLVVGTPLYMTPEQVLGARDFDGRTDLYVCGVLLYQALTGRVPFPINDLAQLIEAIAHTRPLPALALRPDLPPAIGAVIDLAMAHDRAARFQSATDFQARLLAALGAGAAEPARPTSPVREQTGTAVMPRRGALPPQVEDAGASLEIETTPEPMTPWGVATNKLSERAIGAELEVAEDEMQWDAPTRVPKPR